MSKTFNIPVKYNLKVGEIDTIIWQETENGMIKIKQSEQSKLPKYIAEFKDNREGKLQAKAYILGMLNLANILNS